MPREHSDVVDRSYRHRYYTDPHRSVDQQELVYPDGPDPVESPEGPYYDEVPLETLQGVKKAARYVPLRREAWDARTAPELESWEPERRERLRQERESRRLQYEKKRREDPDWEEPTEDESGNASMPWPTFPSRAKP